MQVDVKVAAGRNGRLDDSVVGLTIDDLISPAYRAMLQSMHGDQVWGLGSKRWAPEIAKRTAKANGTTVLDYGCGTGSIVDQVPPWMTVAEFDPAIPGKDALPQPADIVVCLDVLEHVEPDRLHNVLAHIHSLTRKFALLVIATRPAHKRLPDDRNAHLIIDNGAWWCDQLKRYDWELSLLHNTDGELAAWMKVRP